jgi:hypothetical protein
LEVRDVALFGKRKNGTLDAVERELVQLRERQATIDTRLHEACTALRIAHDERRAALVAGDLSDTDAVARCDAACRAAQATVDGLEDANVALSAKIEEADGKLAEAKDQRDREAESAERRRQIEAARAATTAFTAAAEKLAASLQELSAVSMSAGALAGHSSFVGRDLAAGVTSMLSEASSYCDRIAAGGAEIQRQPAPRPEAASPPPAPPVERKQVCVLQDSKWPDVDGVRTAVAHALVDLPLPVAQIALANRTATIDRTVIDRLHLAFGIVHHLVDPARCVDLSSAGAPSGVIHSAAEDGGAKEWVGPTTSRVMTVSPR